MPDVVNDDEVDADDPPDALLIESSARGRCTSAPRSSMLNQATMRPESMASWPRASQKWLLPVPDGLRSYPLTRDAVLGL